MREVKIYISNLNIMNDIYDRMNFPHQEINLEGDVLYKLKYYFFKTVFDNINVDKLYLLDNNIDFINDLVVACASNCILYYDAIEVYKSSVNKVLDNYNSRWLYTELEKELDRTINKIKTPIYFIKDK